MADHRRTITVELPAPIEVRAVGRYTVWPSVLVDELAPDPCVRVSAEPGDYVPAAARALAARLLAAADLAEFGERHG